MIKKVNTSEIFIKVDASPARYFALTACGIEEFRSFCKELSQMYPDQDFAISYVKTANTIRKIFYPDNKDCLCETCVIVHAKNGCFYGQNDAPFDYATKCSC